MKKYLYTSFIGLLFATASCDKCKDENPRAKIFNNGTQKASVQIKTSGGNTTNINNIDPANTSEYSSYASGDVTFTITVNKTDYVKTVKMNECYDYNIAIDGNNTITASSIDRND
jgi:hypothetical protein